MSDTSTYVPHAKTGEPVPVLTPEEQAQQQAWMKAHPLVRVNGWRCHCGAEGGFEGGDTVWMAIGDKLEVRCPLGHVSLISFIPETVTG